MLGSTWTVRGALLTLVAAVALPIIAAATAAMLYVWRAERSAQEHGLREATRALSLALERELRRREAILRTLAASPQLAGQDLAAFHAYAAKVASGPDTVIVLTDPRGQQLLNTRMPFGSPLPRSALGPAPGAPSEIPPVTNLYMAPIARQPSFAVQVPVVRDDRVVYLLGIASFASTLQAMLAEQNLPTGRVATILDGKGVIVARNRHPERYLGRQASSRLMSRLAVADQGVFESVSIDGVPILASFSKLAPPHAWTAVVGVPLSEVRSPARAAASFALFGGLVLVAALAAALWVGRRIATPVRILRSASRDLGSGAALAQPAATGLSEADDVLAELRQADSRIRNASEVLEQRVSDALADAQKAHAAALQSHRLEALGQLTGGVAHDFNNLLMIVRTNAHLLLARAGAGPDRSALERIQRAVDTGAKLTRQLLAFARRQPLRPETVDLATHVPELLQLVQPALSSRIEVECVIEQGVRPVRVDPAELELAVINLAMNSRDAMPEGGRLTVEVADAQDAPFVCIRVRDTGTGIAPEHLPKVFEPFFSTKPVGHGTGLGMSQVHGFSLQAGGRVEVESEVGKGTTVTLFLPALDAQAGAQAGAQQPPGHAAPGQPGGAQGRRILLVEDNAEVCASTTELLRSAGYLVDTVASGDEAKQRLLQPQPPSYHAVLSDIRMPGQTNGIALAAWLRESIPSLPIILTTGYSEELRSAFRMGLEVLPKPASPEVLLQALEGCLAKGNPAT